MRVIIHLMQQSTVSFEAGDVWPRAAPGSPPETDLASFAEEVTRRLYTDGYVGYASGSDAITVIPVGSVKRLDFTSTTSNAAR